MHIVIACERQVSVQISCWIRSFGGQAGHLLLNDDTRTSRICCVQANKALHSIKILLSRCVDFMFVILSITPLYQLAKEVSLQVPHRIYVACLRSTVLWCSDRREVSNENAWYDVWFDKKEQSEKCLLRSKINLYRRHNRSSEETQVEVMRP